MPTRKSTVMRCTVVMGTTLAIFVSSWAQVRKADTDLKGPNAHWHEYVNKEYGFSVLYPNTYKPNVSDDRCRDNDYRRYLLCLAPADSPDPVIFVTIIVAAPFHVSPGSGGLTPARQQIGRNVFYCGIVGSAGVGFADHCVLNLKGQTLEFQFGGGDGPNVGEETKQREAIMLKTLRIF
jgi:hypothetical protein